MSRVGKDLMQGKTLCTARRRNGAPCGNAPMAGTNVCRMHGGAAPQVRRRAQQRILEASDKAAARLVAMMQDDTIAPAIQLAAARDLLDRAGIVGKQEFDVEVKVTGWQTVLADILVDVEEDEDDFSEVIVDAEIVEDSPETQMARDRDIEERDIERRKRKRRGLLEPVNATEKSPLLEPATRAPRITTARTKR
jgi:hypothetical protein